MGGQHDQSTGPGVTCEGTVGPGACWGPGSRFLLRTKPSSASPLKAGRTPSYILILAADTLGLGGKAEFRGEKTHPLPVCGPQFHYLQNEMSGVGHFTGPFPFRQWRRIPVLGTVARSVFHFFFSMSKSESRRRLAKAAWEIASYPSTLATPGPCFQLMTLAELPEGRTTSRAVCPSGCRGAVRGADA